MSRIDQRALDIRSLIMLRHSRSSLASAGRFMSGSSRVTARPKRMHPVRQQGARKRYRTEDRNRSRETTLRRGHNPHRRLTQAFHSNAFAHFACSLVSSSPPAPSPHPRSFPHFCFPVATSQRIPFRGLLYMDTDPSLDKSLPLPPCPTRYLDHLLYCRQLTTYTSPSPILLHLPRSTRPACLRRRAPTGWCRWRPT